MPQNLAAGLSKVPQLWQNSDASFASGGVLIRSLVTDSCWAGFAVFDPLFATATAPIIPPIATTAIMM